MIVETCVEIYTSLGLIKITVGEDKVRVSAATDLKLDTGEVS